MGLDGEGWVAAGPDSPPRPTPPDSDLARLVMFFEAAGYRRRVTTDWYSSDRQYKLTEGPLVFGRHTGAEKTCYWSVVIGEGVGYSGFFCSFYFDESGKLIAHGVWE
jgi:hypothetical protein